MIRYVRKNCVAKAGSGPWTSWWRSRAVRLPHVRGYCEAARIFILFLGLNRTQVLRLLDLLLQQVPHAWWTSCSETVPNAASACSTRSARLTSPSSKRWNSEIQVSEEALQLEGEAVHIPRILGPSLFSLRASGAGCLQTVQKRRSFSIFDDQPQNVQVYDGLPKLGSLVQLKKGEGVQMKVPKEEQKVPNIEFQIEEQKVQLKLEKKDVKLRQIKNPWTEKVSLIIWINQFWLF